MPAEIQLLTDHLEWREVEQGIIVLDSSSGHYLAVNPAGAALWPALVGGTSRQRLEAVLKQSFGLDDETAERDVQAFLSELERHGWLLIDE